MLPVEGKVVVVVVVVAEAVNAFESARYLALEMLDVTHYGRGRPSLLPATRLEWYRRVFVTLERSHEIRAPQ